MWGNYSTMKFKGFFFAALAAASYGTNPLFAIHLYEDGMNPNSVCLFRYLLGLPVLAIILLLRGHSLMIHKNEIFPAALLGVLMAVSSLALFESYNFINSGIASTLLFIYPILVALFMTFFFHERFKKITGACLILMGVGLYFLMKPMSGEPLNMTGILLVGLSSLTYAVYLVMVNVNRAIREIPTTKLLFYVLLFGSGVFAFILCLGEPLNVPNNFSAWSNLFALAMIPTVISLFATTIAIQCIGSTITALFGALEPVTAVLLSVFALGQSITGREILGAVLILSATTLTVIGDKIAVPVLHVRKLFPAVYGTKRHKADNKQSK